MCPEDAFQIARARKYTKEAGLEGKVSFVKGDFMRLEEQFGKNYFDAGRFIHSSLCTHI